VVVRTGSSTPRVSVCLAFAVVSSFFVAPATADAQTLADTPRRTGRGARDRRAMGGWSAIPRARQARVRQRRAFDIVRRNVALSLPGGFFDQAGYSLLNLSASLRYGRARYSVSFSNLADTEYWASQRGSRLYYPGEGRRILATIRIGN